ncbi:MAG: Quinone reductase [Luteibacter sp.]|uniref:NADPH-dependent FMN reductase n=1 Tax=Luteibacter sp. TaxID=1886636 RepID=UPI00137EADD8|nr:NADPH-dependent FMN reductase [Luteibacter sp.]KAF1004894.1 MAG: Quinone reductase [Luteibacter sp.]
MSSLHLIGLSGSLRKDSHSSAILSSLAELLPAHATWSTLDIGELPHYSADLESEALPLPVINARARVQRADAVIMAVPEYNHGIPGVLKNTLDWLSRPVRASCMMGKPVLFVTQSNGSLGGVRAQFQLRETLASMLCVLPPMQEMVVTHASEKIRDGRMVDEAALRFIGAQLHAFLERLAPVEYVA